MKLSTEILAFINELHVRAVESETNVPAGNAAYYNGSKHAFLHAADMAQQLSNRIGQAMIDHKLELK